MAVPGLGWGRSSAGSGSVPPAAPAPASQGTSLVCCVQLAAALLCSGGAGAGTAPEHRNPPCQPSRGGKGSARHLLWEILQASLK